MAPPPYDLGSIWKYVGFFLPFNGLAIYLETTEITLKDLYA